MVYPAAAKSCPCNFSDRGKKYIDWRGVFNENRWLKRCFHSHHAATDSALARAHGKESSSEEETKSATFPIVLFHGICRAGPAGTCPLIKCLQTFSATKYV